MSEERNTLAEVADHRTEIQVKRRKDKASVAKEEKEDRSVVNKSIHAFGGELAVMDAIGSGMTVEGVARMLGFSPSSFYDWVDRGGQARTDAVSRARARGAHSLAESTVAIADATEGAESTVEVQVAKLRSDNRWRLAAKWNAEAYGEQKGPLVNIDLGSLALDALRRRDV